MPATAERRDASGSGEGRAGSLVALVVALACVPLADLITERAGLGPVARQTASDALLVTFVAPALAHGLLRSERGASRPLHPVLPLAAQMLLLATLVQAALLVGWHLPSMAEAAAGDPWRRLAMQAVLLAGASWFWLAVLARRGRGRWGAAAALLTTAVLAAFLGLLLLSLPDGAASQADRQLAALLALALLAPLYLLAALALAGLALADRQPSSRTPTGRTPTGRTPGDRSLVEPPKPR